MAYVPFTGELDSEEKSGFVPFTGELDEPVGRRDVTPFTVSINEQAARPPAAGALTPITRPVGETFRAPRPRLTTEPTEYAPVAAQFKSNQVAAPLIERRGAPVSEETFRELQKAYDAATPKERAALTQLPGYRGSVFSSIDSQYRALDKAAETTPSARLLDSRREARRLKLVVESGMDVDAADALAAQQAARGVPTTRLAQATPSDFDFEAKEEFARPSARVDMREKGGIIYRAKPSNADELAAAAKAIGGKVTGQFESAAAGAWQMVGDLVSATGDLVGSQGMERFGDRLSAGNAQQQKQAQARLAAIGDNPNAALNFVESGVSGAITNFVPLFVAGPILGVSAIVGQVVADEYGAGKAAGLSGPNALARSLALGAAELIGEVASLPTPLMKAFKDLVKNAPAEEIMPTFARYLVKENAAEEVTATLNFGTDKWASFGIKPDSTFEDYLKAVGDTFYQTTAQTLVMGAAGKVAAPVVRAINTPERQFANAFQADVDARQANADAIDYLARWEMSANKGAFADNVARMERAVQARQEDQLRAQQDQADLQQASTAADAAAAADNLSGSLNEMLEPALGGLAAPAGAVPAEPVFTGVDMAPGLDEAEPVFTGADMVAEGLETEPPLFAPAEPAAPEAAINPELEQQFGFDKLRLNAPRPQTIQGTPVASLSDDQLQTMAADESVPPISRRSAAVELTARQAEPGAFTQRAAPQTTGAPSRVSFLGETLATGRNTFGLGDAQGRVSDAPVEGTGAVARAELQARLDRVAAIHGVEVPTLTAPTPENEAAVSVIADALGGVGLADKVVSYADPDGADGFELGGIIAVNTDTQKGIAHSSFHESFHVAERIAAADTAAGRTNTPAQQYVASIHSLFDEMSDQGKRAYITNFLNKEELDAIQDPAAREARLVQMLAEPKTRSEMSADFMGNRATDKRFLASLAKADPAGFGDFVKKWIGILDNLISRLKGARARSNLESIKVDSYLKDLARAKMVARDALVAYRKGTLEQLAPSITPPVMSLRQGDQNVISTGNQNVPGAPAAARQLPGEDGRSATPSYGTPRAGAISVIGRHYSTAARQSLSGAFYGQGLKGAERDRLDRSTDPRLKSRIYFYVDQGAGVRPEAGVGGYAHETRLDNIYDPQTRIVKPQADFNAFESAVINAGFDGYIAPFGNNQAAVVLLGQKHKAVPVKAIGQPAPAAMAESAAPTVLKKGLMSKELSQIDTANIPGARVRAGTLEIPADQQDAANAELERIGSEVRFAKKEQVGPPLPKDFKVYRDVAQKMGLSEAEYNATALPLMTGKIKDKTFQAPNVGGLPEVIQWLTNRRLESGLPVLDLKKPADREILAKLMASEAVAAIRSAGNAVEWYDETVAKTLRIMAVKYPELNTDQNARNAFLMATAISSQTMNVEDNLRYASSQYEAFRKTGKFPEAGTGKSAPAMAKNFSLANKILAEFGADDTRRFLQTKFTKRELVMAGFKIGGESMDENLLGSAVFGPKIGFGFYSNLAGNFEPVTMDMWFMRTLGRLTGTLPAFDPILFPKQVAKLRAALAETGPAERGVYGDQFDPAAVKAAMEADEGAIALARQVHSLHNRQFIKERAAFDSGARVKSALVSASDVIIKSADKPKDAPKSGGERQLIRDVVRRMVDKVAEQTDKRVPPAALQALIWYPEQELYKKLGVRLRVTSQDYAGAAESLLQKEGYHGQKLRTAAESGPGRARQVASQPNAGATGQGRQPTGGAVPFEGKEREDFIAARTARFNAAEVVKQPLKKIFEDLAKRGLAKTRAEAAFTARPDGAQIKYVHENFLDILSELDDSGLVKINCK